MAQYRREQMEKEAARAAASLMAASARTAPKGRGLDSIETLVLDGDDLEKLARGMESKAEKLPAHLAPILRRDAKNVRVAQCVVLIGVRGGPKKPEAPFDCGACGYGSCAKLLQTPKSGRDFSGPVCIFQALDLGIALGSAVKIAGELNMDSRIMYTIGISAKEMNLIDADVIMGIPLSVSGKSPFFDRG
jgi:uncharacterized ferredoxin-like protein